MGTNLWTNDKIFVWTKKNEITFIDNFTIFNWTFFSRIIICCLNGKHSERENISRDGMLYIFGFDKNTIRIINLFINDTF